MIFRILALLSTALLLATCATITEGTTQDIRPNNSVATKSPEHYPSDLAIAVVKPFALKPSLGPGFVKLALGLAPAATHRHEAQTHTTASLAVC